MIKEKNNYKLYRPRNSWDMNYHLIDYNEEVVHLIDANDVTDDEDDEDGGLYIKTLIELSDIPTILEYVWKVEHLKSNTEDMLFMDAIFI